MIVDVKECGVVWQARENGSVRKIPMRAISIDAASFSPDGSRIIAVTVLGTISLYCAHGLVNGADYSPVEQYMRFEFEPS